MGAGRVCPCPPPEPSLSPPTSFTETSNAGHTDVFVTLFDANYERVTTHGLLFKGKNHAARAASYCDMIGARTSGRPLLETITLLAVAEMNHGADQHQAVTVSFIASMIELATT